MKLKFKKMKQFYDFVSCLSTFVYDIAVLAAGLMANSSFRSHSCGGGGKVPITGIDLYWLVHVHLNFSEAGNDLVDFGGIDVNRC